MNSVIKVFIISEVFFWSSWNTIMPIFAVFVNTNIRNGSVEIAAMSVSIHFIARVITELIIGRILVGKGEFAKFVAAIAGTVIVALSFVGFAFSYEVAAVFIFYALVGVGVGIASPGKYSLFSTHLDKNKESVEWGIYDAITLFGMAISAAAGGFIAKLYGFQVLFFISATGTLIGTLPYFLYIRHQNSNISLMERLFGHKQD